MFTKKQFSAIVATAIITGHIVGAYCAGIGLNIAWHAVILAGVLICWSLIVRVLDASDKGKRVRS